MAVIPIEAGAGDLALADAAEAIGIDSADCPTDSMVVFGGVVRSAASDPEGEANDVWVLERANGADGQPVWAQVIAPGGPPSVRQDSGLAYDACANRFLMFGGWRSGSLLGDLWALTLEAPGAEPGLRSVIARTEAEEVEFANGFSVLAVNQPPIVNAGPDQSITLPASAALAGSAIDDGLPTGSALSYSWSKVSGPGVVTFADPSSASTTATFSELGFYILRLTVSDSELTGIAELSVTANANAPQPQEILLPPGAGGPQGECGILSVVGRNTHFSQSETVVSFGDGTSIAAMTVSSSTALTVRVCIAEDAALGLRTVTITTGAEVAVALNAFEVKPGVPRLISVQPNSAVQGQTRSIGVGGRFTHFEQGVTAVSFGSGVTVGAVTVESPTSLTAQITVAEDALVGNRVVTVTTAEESVSTPEIFVVSAGLPGILSVAPIAGQQGDSLILSVTGQFTNFAPGLTSVNLGAGGSRPNPA